MSSATSNSHSSAWRQLLREKYAALTEFDIDLSVEATDEQSFRTRFEALCRSLGERRYTTLLVNLRLYRINILATTVDVLEELTSPENLVALVWGSSSALFKAACEARLQLANVVDLLAPLNAAVPRVTTDIHHFASDTALHVPLRQIVSTYTETLWRITLKIRHGEGLDSLDRSKSIQDDVRDAISALEKEEEMFKKLVANAMHREKGAKEAQQYAGTARSLTGPLDNEVTPRFLTGRFLGRGSEGDVHQVIEPTTGLVYARKQINIGDSSSVPSRAEMRVRNEVEIMQKLHHQHIATVLFWIREQGACFIYMTPCADCNLGAYLELACRAGFPTEQLEQIIPWYGCLLDALNLVHKFNIMHQDVKLTNVLVKEGRVYLADFGHAQDVSLSQGNPKEEYQAGGTPMYRAPEVKPGVSRGLPVDVFSLGCVFSEMLTVLCKRSLQEYKSYRRSPDNSTDSLFSFRADLKKVRRWLADLDPDQGLDIIVYLIKCMLIEDPNERKSADQLCRLLFNAQSSVRFYCHRH